MDYKNMMGIARETNRERDEMDRRISSSGAVSDLSPSMIIRTAMAAIEAGIVTDDFETVAEGQAMLEELMARWDQHVVVLRKH